MPRTFETNNPFGKWLLGHMKESYMNVDAVAQAIDISSKTVYRHIRGEQIPSPSDILIYCYLFDSEEEFDNVMEMADPSFDISWINKSRCSIRIIRANKASWGISCILRFHLL